ncbi:MAG TPA: hypothetical protein VHY20_03250 [Pirellulales bacterium]|jgi:hypothetical protein|nr:hypothetical protein [Pirellulales bacterium]
MILLAHHFEPTFAPIYAGQFALGIWAGWRMAAALASRWQAKSGKSAGDRH